MAVGISQKYVLLAEGSFESLAAAEVGKCYSSRSGTYSQSRGTHGGGAPSLDIFVDLIG